MTLLEKQYVKKLIKENNQYVALLKTNEEELLNFIFSKAKGQSKSELKEEFVDYLFAFFQEKQLAELEQRKLKNSLDLYQKYMQAVNDFPAFVDLKVKDIEEIVLLVDKQVEKIKSNTKKNKESIHSYILANIRQVPKNIKIQELETEMNKAYKSAKLIDTVTLEHLFKTEIKKISFHKECEKFLTENLSSFDINYFNKKQFLTEIKLTENYINFIPKKNYKSSWMLPYLERHINRNKEKT